MKKITLILVIITMFCLVLTMSACSDNLRAFLGFTDDFIQPDSSKPNPEAKITITYTDDAGVLQECVLEYELHYDKAPITVMNFIELAKKGFYNQSIIHRSAQIEEQGYSAFNYVEMGIYKLEKNDVEDKLVISQIDYSIIGEFTANGWEKNTLTHEFGALGMTRTSGAENFNTASASFYMCLSENETRNGNYALFATLKSEFPSTLFEEMRIPKVEPIEIKDTELLQQVPVQIFTITVEIIDNGVEYGNAPHIG